MPIDGCEVGECVGATPSTSDILGSTLGGPSRAAETGGARGGADARFAPSAKSRGVPTGALGGSGSSGEGAGLDGSSAFDGLDDGMDIEDSSTSVDRDALLQVFLNI